MPPDVERAELWEELKLAIGQVVVNPVRYGPPIGGIVSLDKPRDHDTRHCSAQTILVPPVPDMRSVVALIGTAVVPLLVPHLVYC